MYQVILQEEAAEDLAGAYNWYEEQQVGLGDELMNEAAKCLQKLSHQPQHYTCFNSNYRRIKANRFPYYFLYGIRDRFVIVYQFYHAKQNNPRQ